MAIIRDIDETQAPLLDHLLELRTRLLRCVIALAITGGRHRTLEEHRQLLGRNGFRLTRSFDTAAAVSIIESTSHGTTATLDATGVIPNQNIIDRRSANPMTKSIRLERM